MRLRRGIQGERDAAHYLDNYLSESPKYCWNHEAMFGGLQYCRQHQEAFRKLPEAARSS